MADSVDVLTYLKSLVSEVHALRREQMQIAVRIDDIRARLEKRNIPPPPAMGRAAPMRQDETGVRSIPKKCREG